MLLTALAGMLAMAAADAQVLDREDGSLDPRVAPDNAAAWQSFVAGRQFAFGTALGCADCGGSGSDDTDTTPPATPAPEPESPPPSEREDDDDDTSTGG